MKPFSCSAFAVLHRSAASGLGGLVSDKTVSRQLLHQSSVCQELRICQPQLPLLGELWSTGAVNSPRVRPEIPPQTKKRVIVTDMLMGRKEPRESGDGEARF